MQFLLASYFQFQWRVPLDMRKRCQWQKRRRDRKKDRSVTFSNLMMGAWGVERSCATSKDSAESCCKFVCV
jgi:hypothetical protein